MINFVIIKLDSLSRYRGYKYFSHRIEVVSFHKDKYHRSSVYENVYRSDAFDTLRQWFIDSFGNSIELDTYHKSSPKPVWCYDTGTKVNRIYHIYLNERELSWFLLSQEKIEKLIHDIIE